MEFARRARRVAKEFCRSRSVLRGSCRAGWKAVGKALPAVLWGIAGVSVWSDRWRLFAAFISPLFAALVRRRLLCSNKPCPVSQTLGSNVRLDAIAPCVLSSTLERLRWQLYPALVYSTAASPDKRRPSRPNGKHRISATRIEAHSRPAIAVRSQNSVSVCTGSGVVFGSSIFSKLPKRVTTLKTKGIYYAGFSGSANDAVGNHSCVGSN
jgi:hypothetical protein